MDNQAIESALTAIEEQIQAIRDAMGQGGETGKENPLITPEKPAGNSPFEGMKLG